jgi:hypothetical protein
VTLTDQPKKSKYNSKKIEVDGLKFDSKTEYKRWTELVLLEKSGHIQNLQRQVTFELQPKFKKKGVSYRAITYVADFTYVESGQLIVEDRKGFAQIPAFQIKKKLFEYKFSELTLLITK